MTRLASLACLVALTACTRTVTRPDGQTGLLPAGSAAPEVVGYDVNHTAVKLSELKGHAAVVFFYPMDGSPGCTKEVCGFRGAWKEYSEAHIGVIGVSGQSETSHQDWLKKEQLPFALAADESGEIARSYGVGASLFGHQRVTFLVGPDGKVAQVWPKVDPSMHADEMLAAAKQLTAPK